jgi:hypothetical protein
VNSAFLDYYCCPENFACFTSDGEPSAANGYFRFGFDAICYGQCSQGPLAQHVEDDLYNAEKAAVVDKETLRLPFNPSEIIANLRYERYASCGNGADLGGAVVKKAYYLVRPLLPVSVRKHLQRIQLRDWHKIPFPNWPVDLTVEHILEKLLVLLLRTAPTHRIPFI